MNVAIIPARGGSKRIPNKNIKPFSGKPIIGYSIEAAQNCGLFDRIVVSTDSDEIATVANSLGAETPFKRPQELSDDQTPTAPVLAHAIKCLADEGGPPEYACCIYATAPFVGPEYIKKGFDVLVENHVPTVFSVTSFAFPIFRALRITEAGKLEMFWPEHELARSNDLPEAYHDAGQFYWLDCRAFLGEPRLYTRESMPVVIPRYLVQDIDTPEDWETAEKKFAAIHSRE